ncbi:TatD family hydrolase [Chloroflexota bacterium]
MFSDGNAYFMGFAANEVAEIVKRSKQEGIELIVTASMDLGSSIEAVAIAKTYDIVHAAVGIHPLEAVIIDSNRYNQLRALAESPEVVALGQIGMHHTNELDDAALQVQQRAFIEQLRLAWEVDKPAIICSPGLEKEVMDILRQTKGVKKILHSFRGDEAMFAEAADMGCYFAVGFGLLAPETTPDKERLAEILKKIPSDRLILESHMYSRTTLSPRFPWHIKKVAEVIAILRGTTAEIIGRISTDNLRRILQS